MESYTVKQIEAVSNNLYADASAVMRERQKHSPETVHAARADLRHCALLNEFALDKLIRGDEKSIKSLSYPFQDSVGFIAQRAAQYWIEAGCPENAMKLCTEYTHQSQMKALRVGLEKLYLRALDQDDWYRVKMEGFQLF